MDWSNIEKTEEIIETLRLLNEGIDVKYQCPTTNCGMHCPYYTYCKEDEI